MTHPRASLLRDLAHIVDSTATHATPENAGVAAAIVQNELALLKRASEEEQDQ